MKFRGLSGANRSGQSDRVARMTVIRSKGLKPKIGAFIFNFNFAKKKLSFSVAMQVAGKCNVGFVMSEL